MLRDEAAHHLHTFRIVENCERDSGLSKQVFRPEKIAVLADDDGGNAEEQRRPRAHDARAEGAYESELAPVAAASGIADANDFSMCRGVAGLNSQIVAARDHLPKTIREN